MCEHELQTAVTKIIWSGALEHQMRCDACNKILNTWPGGPYTLDPIPPKHVEAS